MAYKSDVYTVFPKFKSMVEKYFKASLATLYTDVALNIKVLNPTLHHKVFNIKCLPLTHPNM